MTPELDSLSIPEPQTKGPECSTNAALESAVPGCLTELPPAPEQPKTTFDLKADTDDAQSTDAPAFSIFKQEKTHSNGIYKPFM